jgi:hypothetical protein
MSIEIIDRDGKLARLSGKINLVNVCIARNVPVAHPVVFVDKMRQQLIRERFCLTSRDWFRFDVLWMQFCSTKGRGTQKERIL